MNNNELKEKVERLAEVMRQGEMNGNIAKLPSQSLADAESLYNEAIAIIEEITGEKWDFSFANWC